MTDESRRQNLGEELARAAQALQAAQALLAAGLFPDSVSRAYYATFHVLRALLLTRGVDPQSHRGVLHLFNREFVRTGILPSSHNRLLGGLQRARELADYDAATSFSQDDAGLALDDARKFRDEALAVLAREGWTSS